MEPPHPLLVAAPFLSLPAVAGARLLVVPQAPARALPPPPAPAPAPAVAPAPASAPRAGEVSEVPPWLLPTRPRWEPADLPDQALDGQEPELPEDQPGYDEPAPVLDDAPPFAGPDQAPDPAPDDALRGAIAMLDAQVARSAVMSDPLAAFTPPDDDGPTIFRPTLAESRRRGLGVASPPPGPDADAEAGRVGGGVVDGVTDGVADGVVDGDPAPEGDPGEGADPALPDTAAPPLREGADPALPDTTALPLRERADPALPHTTAPPLREANAGPPPAATTGVQPLAVLPVAPQPPPPPAPPPALRPSTDAPASAQEHAAPQPVTPEPAVREPVAAEAALPGPVAAEPTGAQVSAPEGPVAEPEGDLPTLTGPPVAEGVPHVPWASAEGDGDEAPWPELEDEAATQVSQQPSTPSGADPSGGAPAPSRGAGQEMAPTLVPLPGPRSPAEAGRRPSEQAPPPIEPAPAHAEPALTGQSSEGPRTEEPVPENQEPDHQAPQNRPTVHLRHPTPEPPGASTYGPSAPGASAYDAAVEQDDRPDPANAAPTPPRSTVAPRAFRGELPQDLPAVPRPTPPATPVQARPSTPPSAVVPATALRSFEKITGVDLGFVPVNRGPQADRAAQLGARAFTRGGTVYLPQDAGPLDHPGNQGLLAHELAHVLQQRALGPRTADHGPAGELLEEHAEAVEQAVLGGYEPEDLPETAMFDLSPGGLTWTPQEGFREGAGPAGVVQRAPLVSEGFRSEEPAELYAGTTTSEVADRAPIEVAPETPAHDVVYPDTDTDEWVEERATALQEQVPQLTREEVAEIARRVARTPVRVPHLDLTDPHVLDGLAGTLYERLRLQLRNELIADRERVGALTEFH